MCSVGAGAAIESEDIMILVKLVVPSDAHLTWFDLSWISFLRYCDI
jgi:hypothetical protein